MNLGEEKEQNQNVEAKYLDPETGISLELRKDRLYCIKKTTKIIKPKSLTELVSPFEALDHYSTNPIPIMYDFEESTFLTDELMDEIIKETYENE